MKASVTKYLFFFPDCLSLASIPDWFVCRQNHFSIFQHVLCILSLDVHEAETDLGLSIFGSVCIPKCLSHNAGRPIGSDLPRSWPTYDYHSFESITDDSSLSVFTLLCFVLIDEWFLDVYSINMGLHSVCA